MCANIQNVPYGATSCSVSISEFWRTSIRHAWRVRDPSRTGKDDTCPAEPTKRDDRASFRMHKVDFNEMLKSHSLGADDKFDIFIEPMISYHLLL